LALCCPHSEAWLCLEQDLLIQYVSVNHLLSNMLQVAFLVVFLLSDTRSSGMLLLTYFLRSAQMHRLNHSFNLFLVNHYPTVLNSDNHARLDKSATGF